MAELYVDEAWKDEATGTEVKVGENTYVVGKNAFADLAAALAAANNKVADTIYVKSDSDVAKPNSNQSNVSNLDKIVIEDGVTVTLNGKAKYNWNPTYYLDIKAGGTFQANISDGNSYGSFAREINVGEADSDKTAILNLATTNDDGEVTGVMSICSTNKLKQKFTANNAEITVGDLRLKCNVDINNTVLNVLGVFQADQPDTGTFDKVIANSTVNVKGTLLSSKNTAFIDSDNGGCSVFSDLTLDKTTVTVGDNTDDVTAAKVYLGYQGNLPAAGTLTLTNGSSITVEEATEVEVANKVTLTDSAITAGDIKANETKGSVNVKNLTKGQVYYVVVYDANGNELDTVEITATGTSKYVSFESITAGTYTVKCFTDEAKTIQNGKDIKYTVEAVGTLDLTNSDIVAKDIVLTGGNLTMDYKSSVTFTGIENGYIVVKDAASYIDNANKADGNYKLLNYIGEGNMTVDDYKLILNNAWNDNYLVFNNTLYVTDQDKATLFVNSKWSGTNIGDTVNNGGIYQYNAFDKLDAVADNATDETKNVVISGGSYTTDSEKWLDLIAGNVKNITTDGTVTLEKKGNLLFEATEKGDYTVSGNFVTTGYEGYLWENGKNLGWKINGITRFKGADGVVFNINNASFTSASAVQFIGGKTIIAENSSFSSILNSEHKVAVYGEVINYGKINIDTTGSPETALLIGHDSYKNNANKLTISGKNAFVNISTNSTIDANIHSSGTLVVEKEASFKAKSTVKNAGTIKVSGATFEAGTLENSNFIDITSGKAIVGTFTNTGIVKVNNSSLLIKDLTNNDGTISVTGGTHFEIDKLTGSISAHDAKIDGYITGGTLKVTGGSSVKLKPGLASIVLGDFTNTVNATVDVTDWTKGDFTAQNGTVKITGKMNTQNIGITLKVGGFYKTGHESDVPVEGEAAMGNTTVEIAKDAVVKANQVYIAENSALKEHTLNVYGTLDAKTIYNKPMGNLNVYGVVKGNYLQGAGNVTVSGTDAKVILTGTSSIDSIKIGTDAEGKRSSFVIEKGAIVTTEDTVHVGYSETRHGDLLIKGSTLDVNNLLIQDGSTVTVSGASTLNIDSSKGVIAVENGTILSGNLAADLDLKGDVTFKAAFKGTITGNKDIRVLETINGDFKLKDGSVVKSLVVSSGVVFDKYDYLSNVTIKNNSTTLISLADKALRGNKVEGLVNLTDVESDNFFDVNLDLKQIVQIDGITVENLGGIYYYVDAHKVTHIITKKDNGIKLADSQNGGAALEDVTKLDVKENNEKFAKVNVVMEEGTSTIKVGNGKVDKSGEIDYMSFAIGSVGKDDNGGKNDFSFGNYSKVAVNGQIDALGKMTIGKNSILEVDGTTTGNDTKQTLSIDSNSEANFQDIKFDEKQYTNDKDTFTIKGGTEVTTKNISGLDTLSIAAGKKDKFTSLKVDGNYIAPAVNNSITLGDNAKIKITGYIDNGNDTSTGTTIKAGKNADVNVLKGVDGLAGLTIGKDSKFGIADISGTEKDNKINLGANTNGSFGAIDLQSGKNTIALGNDSEIKIDGDVSNVNTFTIGNNTKVEITKGINQIGNLTIGKDSKFTVCENLSGKNINQTVKIGANSTTEFADIDLMGGKNTLSLAAGAKLEANNVSHITSLNLAAGAEMKVESYTTAPEKSNITLGNDAKLTIYNGNLESSVSTTIKAGNYALIDVQSGRIESVANLTLGKEASLKATNLYGTEGNDKLSIGADAGVIISSTIDMKGGKNTLSLGKGAYLKAQSIDHVQTITAGADVDLEVKNIYGVQKLTFGNDAIVGYEDAIYGRSIDNITCTEGNDTIKFGNNNITGYINTIDMGESAKDKDTFTVGKNSKVLVNKLEGADTISIGDNSFAWINTINMGESAKDKDTITLGKNAKLYVQTLEGVETINAAKGAEIWFFDNPIDLDVDLSDCKGSWNKADIYDYSGEFNSSAAELTLGGSVYSNEFDFYDVNYRTINNITAQSGVNVWYSNDDGKSWNIYLANSNQEIKADYIRVGVDFSNKDQYAKKDYSIGIVLA